MHIDENNIKFKAVRASGPGGQNVNRRSTKVQIWVEVGKLGLTEEEEKRIREKLAHRLNQRDELEVVVEDQRSQEENRDIALERLRTMIEEALRVPPERIPTEAPPHVERGRVVRKKATGAKKEERTTPWEEVAEEEEGKRA